jgi:tetratricopeptide (TPR) repeat protein
MTASRGTEERNLVPRWRPFQVSAALGELASSSVLSQPSMRPPEMEALHAFTTAPTLHKASDALGLAFGLEDPAPLRPVVEFIESAEANSLLVAAAAQVRRRLDQVSTTREENWFHVDARSAVVSHIREELVRKPRNPTKWVDLALAQTLLGQPVKARRSIMTALALAPFNRFVLRSAVRFFIHIEDPEAAQHTLKGAKGSADPWILAAEIASDEAAGSPPSSMKEALFALSSENFSSWAISELACTVAHAEFNGGRDKRARKFLNQASPQPTENAAAQIAFESQRGGFTVRPARDPERRFEAEALEAKWQKDWPAAMESGLKWQNDQPFAVEPAAFLSYVAAVGAERYDIAEQAARTGRLANPQDATITNNLAFALANQDKHNEAKDILLNCPPPEDSEEAAVYSATRGLVAFRGGSIEEGREDYKKAVDSCLDLGLSDKAALAASYWAREEVRAKTLSAVEIINTAVRLASRAPSSDAEVVLARLSESLSTAGSSDWLAPGGFGVR